MKIQNPDIHQRERLLHQTKAAPCCESLWKSTLSAKTWRVLNNHLTVSSFLFRFYLGIYGYFKGYMSILLISFFWLSILYQSYLFKDQGRFDQAILEFRITCVNFQSKDSEHFTETHRKTFNFNVNLLNLISTCHFLSHTKDYISFKKKLASF